MDRPMGKEESYSERRQLFKNIWDTAMNIDEKEGNVINKPKVIKTLRLDEVDRCIAGRKKKQRIRNLRLVCNKLLDFCDRQDADDMYYGQMMAKGRESLIEQEDENVAKQLNSGKHKRKAKKARSRFTPIQNFKPGIASPNLSSKTSRNNSPSKIKKTSFVLTNCDVTKNKSLETPNIYFQEEKKRSSRRREKNNGIESFSGGKVLTPTKRTYSNKQLFPITKVTIS